MHSFLDRINSPKDLKGLTYNQLPILADEVRKFLISNVSKTGGHLASNLGVVELTIALHRTFDAPIDKIIFDVGHQTYVHKMFTGRKGNFSTLRKKGGMSGFPKPNESGYDCFPTGHSSTSISLALGMACARDIRMEKNHVVAVIGDGAMTGGEAFEALNDGGMMDSRLIVVLNDNQMSIAENVGAMSAYFRRISSNKKYFRFKKTLEWILLKIPVVGRQILRLLHKIKGKIKNILFVPTIFDEMGFTYIGPFDGHNIKLLCKQIERAKLLDKPVFIHVCTKKGKGYSFAENKPYQFHGVSKFDISTGESLSGKKGCSYCDIFGESMIALAEDNEKIVCVTPAMLLGSGLKVFSEKFPKRFFDVGIAEQHAVTFAAGMAGNGMTSVVSLYSTFMQRAYDQVLHDVCIANSHVVFAIDRAGAVGEDGETHQGMFDLAIMLPLPNMSILAPSCFEELRLCMEYACMKQSSPITVRYPRGNKQAKIEVLPLENKLAQVVVVGSDICIFAVGIMVDEAMKAAEILKRGGISCGVINLRWIKPLDEETIIAYAKKVKLCVSIEDGVCIGGVGEQILALLNRQNVQKPVEILGFPDKFIEHAKVEEIYEDYGLTAEKVAQRLSTRYCQL